MGFIARLREDIANVRQHDPAARGTVEIILNYSGMHAIWSHRLSHRLWQRDTTKADALDVHRPQSPKNGHSGKRWDIEVPYALRMRSMVFVCSRRL